MVCARERLASHSEKQHLSPTKVATSVVGGTRGEEESELAVREVGLAREEKGLYATQAVMWREVLRQIAQADIANMTPLQALVLLNEMKKNLLVE